MGQCHRHQQHLEEDCLASVEAPCFLSARTLTRVSGRMAPLGQIKPEVLDDGGILCSVSIREQALLLNLCAKLNK